MLDRVGFRFFSCLDRCNAEYYFRNAYPISLSWLPCTALDLEMALQCTSAVLRTITKRETACRPIFACFLHDSEWENGVVVGWAGNGGLAWAGQFTLLAELKGLAWAGHEQLASAGLLWARLGCYGSAWEQRIGLDWPAAFGNKGVGPGWVVVC